MNDTEVKISMYIGVNFSVFLSKFQYVLVNYRLLAFTSVHEGE